MKPDERLAMVGLIHQLRQDNKFLTKQQTLLTEKLIDLVNENQRLRWIINGRLDGPEFERLMND